MDAHLNTMVVGTRMSDVSEKISKTIGRPRALNPEQERLAWGVGIFKQGKSRRTHLNAYYAIRALTRLGLKHPGFSGDKAIFLWLSDDKANPVVYRATILAELGRIEDPDLLQEVAERICELKPRTSDAVAMIRRCRLENDKKGDTWQSPTWCDTQRQPRNSYSLR
jgi:hypothetical protein